MGRRDHTHTHTCTYTPCAAHVQTEDTSADLRGFGPVQGTRGTSSLSCAFVLAHIWRRGSTKARRKREKARYQRKRKHTYSRTRSGGLDRERERERWREDVCVCVCVNGNGVKNWVLVRKTRTSDCFQK